MACRKCGSTELTPSGQCRRCMAAYMRERRHRKEGRAEPKPHNSGAAGTSDLTNPGKRLTMMLERHDRTLKDFDRQRDLVDEMIADARDGGLSEDVKSYIAVRQKLISDASAYDLKMSKELAIWREFVELGDRDTTPLVVKINVIGEGQAPKIIEPVLDPRKELGLGQE